VHIWRRLGIIGDMHWKTQFFFYHFFLYYSSHVIALTIIQAKHRTILFSLPVNYLKDLRDFGLDKGGVDPFSPKYRLSSIIYDVAFFRLFKPVRSERLHDNNALKDTVFFLSFLSLLFITCHSINNYTGKAKTYTIILKDMAMKTILQSQYISSR
jgi:hypothetical protein